MTRHGFSFLLCADPELLKDQIALLLKDSGFAPRIFWGDEEMDARYWQALTVPAMMGPHNAVVLRRAQEQNDEFWNRLEPLLAMVRPSVWPIFCLENEWKKGKPPAPKNITKGKFWTVAGKRGWIWEHPGLSRATLGQELDRFATRHKILFPPKIKANLVQSLPLSSIALRHELEKIRLLLGEEKTVRPEHLTALEGDDPFDLFAFLNALQNPSARHTVWARLLGDPAMSSGDILFPVCSLLLREARQLWHLAHGEGNKVQLFPKQKMEKTELAKRLGPARISRLWDMVLRADTALKTGRLKQNQALESLIKEALALW